MANDGPNQNYPDLETPHEHQQDHLSLLIIHFVFHTNQERCRWGASDEKLVTEISAGHL